MFLSRKIPVPDAKIQWPETVPVLKPENMYARLFQKPDDENCRCLMGWINVVFDCGAHHAPTRARATAYDLLHKILGTDNVATWNDSHTPEERVEAWDKLCEMLGYTEEESA